MKLICACGASLDMRPEDFFKWDNCRFEDKEKIESTGWYISSYRNQINCVVACPSCMKRLDELKSAIEKSKKDAGRGNELGLLVTEWLRFTDDLDDRILSSEEVIMLAKVFGILTYETSEPTNWRMGSFLSQSCKKRVESADGRICEIRKTKNKRLNKTGYDIVVIQDKSNEAVKTEQKTDVRGLKSYLNKLAGDSNEKV